MSGEDDYNDGKKSSFNEASFRVIRFDELQKQIMNSLINLPNFDVIAQKYEYEKAISFLILSLNQSYGKMTSKEKEQYREFRKKSITLCREYPISKTEFVNGLTKSKIKITNHENLDKITDMIFEGMDFLQEVMERTGYSAPNEQSEEGYD